MTSVHLKTKTNEALQSIAKKFDIEIPFYRDRDKYIAFALMTIDQNIKPFNEEELLNKIEQIEGIGQATMKRIREGLN